MGLLGISKNFLVYLGDLILGEVHQGEKIRKGKEFVNKVVVSLKHFSI